jgi:tRNA dimethylallyltransferase
LVGPTASGKTDLALGLAGDIFEIISADSVQVYRRLDIGSGKPAPAQRELVRHHLVDIVDPDRRFTAGDFCREALLAAGDIEKRGKIPLFVGGTGLYIDSFFGGLSGIPPVDPLVSATIRDELERRGPAEMYAELERVDRAFALRIHPNDRQRIARGLEVFRGTGRALSGFFGERSGAASEKTIFIGLNPPRDELHGRIERRFDLMMERGFLEEVRLLRESGYGPELGSMKSIGYRELNMHLDGKLPLDEAVRAAKLETKRYAKRQMTWFRRNGRITWFEDFQVEKIEKMLYTWRMR